MKEQGNSMAQKTAGCIVIFGGARGIGLATATRACGLYEKVVIADVDGDMSKLDIVRTGRAESSLCDALDPAAVTTLLDSAAERHGRLAAVVTVIGGAHIHDPLILDLAAWRKETAFNLDTAYIVATAAASLMVKRQAGAIVTTSSSYASVPKSDRIGYAASKAGVIALTKSLAMATARFNVRVNCVAPGATDTERLRAMTGSEHDLDTIREAAVQGRIATPEEVAEAVLFLCADSSYSITGQVLWVNNGSYMP